jgi:hypothetical protein
VTRWNRPGPCLAAVTVIMPQCGGAPTRSTRALPATVTVSARRTAECGPPAGQPESRLSESAGPTRPGGALARGTVTRTDLDSD